MPRRKHISHAEKQKRWARQVRARDEAREAARLKALADAAARESYLEIIHIFETTRLRERNPKYRTLNPNLIEFRRHRGLLPLGWDDVTGQDFEYPAGTDYASIYPVLTPADLREDAAARQAARRPKTQSGVISCNSLPPPPFHPNDR